MVDSLPRQQVKVGVPREEGQLHITFGKGGAREGAGRKGIGLTKKISLTLPEQVWDDLEAACRSKQISRSELIRQIILVHDPAAPARQEEASHEG
ncbi:ribbon-helix-helix protein, CopG family [Paenibacillus terrigena]|uniref:ribbon-helix-helix protein, CopG family n=1 Tax=Paenibacillus terrigena TaxID=369333 RepID=UPI00035CAA9C|nr:ribbon-helix-helix protein, CopG family [Paenibacillus terrigena]